MVIFDPSVATGYGRVINLGKLNDRQNMIIAGGILAIIGILIAMLAKEAAPEALPFLQVMENGNLHAMEEMLKAGADPNGLTPSGKTWLQAAVEFNRIPQTELLLHYGADPDRVTDKTFLSARQYLMTNRENEVTSATEELKALLDKAPVGGQRTKAIVGTLQKAEGQTTSLGYGQELIVQLQTLASLRESGTLSTEEFDLAKSKLLSAR